MFLSHMKFSIYSLRRFGFSAPGSWVPCSTAEDVALGGVSSYSWEMMVLRCFPSRLGTLQAYFSGLPNSNPSFCSESNENSAAYGGKCCSRHPTGKHRHSSGLFTGKLCYNKVTSLFTGKLCYYKVTSLFSGKLCYYKAVSFDSQAWVVPREKCLPALVLFLPLLTQWLFGACHYLFPAVGRILCCSLVIPVWRRDEQHSSFLPWKAPA